MMKANLKYTHIEANKFSEPHEHVTINNNSTITQVEIVDGVLSVGFLFKSMYEPKIGEIKIEGNILIKDSADKLDAVVEEWNASGQKNLPVDIAEEIHNYILSNCVTETVIIAREIQLPSPIPLPRISLKNKVKNKEETNSYIR